MIWASYQIRISTRKLWVEVLRSSASTTRNTYDDGSEYKGGNHKLYEYSARAMADLKVQTGQSYFATNVCFQLATTIWYGQEKYSKQIMIYFPGEINNVSTYGRVPPLLRRRVGPCWYVEGAAGAMAVGGGEEDFRRQTAGSGDISCCRGRGGRRSGNGKVDDGADEARGGDERILV